MGNWDLPDIYTLALGRPSGLDIIIYQTNPSCPCYNYRTVKNFGGQKVWRKGLLQVIGEKNFGEF